MSLLRLAWHGVWQRRLTTVLTALSVALGVALVLFVARARDSARTSFRQVARGYDVIVGPTHGSPLQITLNTLFHVGPAGGTIPWETYTALRQDERVAYAVPYAVGDNFRGHHVVGTTLDLFHVLRDARGAPLGTGVRGRLFAGNTFEAVIGAQVAAKAGLRRGDDFGVSHGTEEGGQGHEERWVVVGILRPTGTPADRALFIPIETFYQIDDHQKEADRIRERREGGEAEGDGEDPPPADDGPPAEDGHHGHSHSHDHSHGADGDHHVHGLSAVGVRLYAPFRRFELRSEFQKDRRDAQVAIPVEQVSDLLAIVSSVDGVLEVVAWLVTVVAALSILVGLYTSIQGRRREIALLRALGARPGHVFGVIVLESLLICLLGALGGVLLGQLALVAAGPLLLERYGVVLAGGLGGLEIRVVAVLVGLGLLAGLLPAWRGLRTPVADHLHPVD